MGERETGRGSVGRYLESFLGKMLELERGGTVMGKSGKGMRMTG